MGVLKESEDRLWVVPICENSYIFILSSLLGAHRYTAVSPGCYTCKCLAENANKLSMTML